MGPDKPARPIVSCAKCGACTTVCPVYRVTGREELTARGRLHLLEKIVDNNPSGTSREIFSKCLLCGACRQACPRGIDLPTRVVENRCRFPNAAGRGRLARSLTEKCLSSQSIMTGLSRILKVSAPLLTKLPADSGLRLKLGLTVSGKPDSPPLEHNDTKEISTDNSAGTMLFTGCFARHLDQSITTATAKLISQKGSGAPNLVPEQNCCGLAFYGSGNLEEARRLARLNISAFEGSDAPIVVLCGSCFSHLSGYGELLADDDEWFPRATVFAARLQELSVFLTDRESRLEKRPSGQKKRRVVYHDPCHLRHLTGLKEAPRELLAKMSRFELIELAGSPQCCGFGGLFNLAHPDISKSIAENLVEDIMALSPDLVTTTCTGCLIQLRHHLAASDSRVRVLHLAQLLTGEAG